MGCDEGWIAWDARNRGAEGGVGGHRPPGAWKTPNVLEAQELGAGGWDGLGKMGSSTDKGVTLLVLEGGSSGRKASGVSDNRTKRRSGAIRKGGLNGISAVTSQKRQSSLAVIVTQRLRWPVQQEMTILLSSGFLTLIG
jgi:hypothetical protein